jgi:AcrR family transcriptional regulator
VATASTIRGAALSLFAERGYRATTMADIGAAVGIRGPSLYRHVRSKQDLLVEIMTDTMTELLALQTAARAAGGGPAQQLRRMVEAHVRFHAGHREQAFVGNREIDSLEPPNRDRVLALRSRYEHRMREVITAGIADGVLQVGSARLAAYAILDMGIGVATWFRPTGPHTVDEISYAYADYALSVLGQPARPPASAGKARRTK